MGTYRKMKVYQTRDIGNTTVVRNEWIDVVGADDLPEVSISDKIVKEKASMLLWGKFMDKDKDFLDMVLIRQPYFNYSIPISNDYRRGLMFDYLTKEPMETKEKYNNEFIDLWQYNDDFFDIENVYKELQMSSKPYSDYSLGNAYKIIPLPLSWKNQNSICAQYQSFPKFQQAFYDWIKSGFPHFSSIGKIQFPFFDDTNETIKTNFILKKEDSSDSVMIVKMLCVQKGILSKCFFPIVFLRDKGNNRYASITCFPKNRNNRLFGGKHLPLYNSFGLERIRESECVVICGSLEDADVLQKQNKDCKKYAFTAFICDPESFDQIDFSPLNKKRIGFLISNHSGRNIEDERLKIKKLYEYLKNRRNGIKDFFFLEREVNYPAIHTISFECYYDAYTKHRPKIVDTKEYDESQFRNLFKDNNKPILDDKKEDETEKTKSTHKKPHPGRPKHHNLTAEKTILRPFIRRGCTTVLTGDPGVGKSRFTIALAAQVAGSKTEFLADRLWTRCLPAKGEKAGYKVVYWVFDDVEKDDIDLQRNFYAKGLSKVQEKNLIIEPARSIRKRDCESLKEELKKYVSRGTPNHPVDLLIVDTLLSFARSPAKIFTAFEELVRLKDELPSLAILLIHHNSKEGNPYGGVLATNMPRVIIEMKRDNPSVTDDLGDPIMINIIKHSNEHFGIDIVPFEIRLDDDHFVVTNNRNLPQDEVKKLVIYEYKTNRLESYSSTDIGRLLGVHRRKIETVWNEDAEKNTKALWNEIKRKLKEQAKAKKESASIRRKTSVRNKPTEDFCIPDENKEEDD